MITLGRKKRNSKPRPYQYIPPAQPSQAPSQLLQRELDRLAKSPNSIMRMLLKECFEKVIPPEEINADNIKENFDIIESYVYTVFSIQTGFTRLPELAVKCAAEELINWALKIPDIKLARKFIASFDIRIAKAAVQKDEWDKANGNKWKIRYEKRKANRIQYFNQYSGPITIQGESIKVDLINPEDVTEPIAQQLGESIVSYLIAETNQIKLKTNLYKIYQWANSIPDNVILTKFISTIVVMEDARAILVANESWTFFAVLMKPRISK